MTKNCVVMAMLVVASGLMINGGYGQSFPTKPIRIVTAEAGGGNDFAVRLIAPLAHAIKLRPNQATQAR